MVLFPPQPWRKSHQHNVARWRRKCRNCWALQKIFWRSSCKESWNMTPVPRLMEEIRLTSWYGNHPIIYKVLYIPGGAGFLPSAVLLVFSGKSLQITIDLHQLWCTKWVPFNNPCQFESEHPIIIPSSGYVPIKRSLSTFLILIDRPQIPVINRVCYNST